MFNLKIQLERSMSGGSKTQQTRARTQIKTPKRAYNTHTHSMSPRRNLCPSQGQGAVVAAGGPRRPYGVTRVNAGQGRSASVHSVDCFDRRVFPKQEESTLRGVP